MTTLKPAADGLEAPTGTGVAGGAGFRKDHATKPTRRRVAAGSWPAYAAAAVAVVFGGVSFYWAAGGMAGVHTLGGTIEKMAVARDASFVTILWVTAVLKLAGGGLALALIRPWGRKLPRRWLLRAAWGAAALLTLYGALQTASVALVRLDIVNPDPPVPSSVLWWRLLLWEPWFLLWGVLLGLAAQSNVARSRRPG